MSKPPLTHGPARVEDRPGPGKLRGNAAARLVPQARLSSPIPWVIAIMIALVVVASAGGLSLRNLAENARADLSGALTVQIVVANKDMRSQQVEAAAKLLVQQPRVSVVRVVPEAELKALLEPWLGTTAGNDEIPIPGLIDVELTETASEDDIARLESALATAVPDARVDAQSDWLQPVYSALAALQYLVVGLIALLALACAAAVWLASRSTLANHSDTVEILHLLGGTDQQLVRVFQRSVVRDAVLGSAVGLVLGATAVWVLGLQFAALDSGMTSGGGLRSLDWAIIALIPIAGVILAMMTGRITILAALRRML